MANTTFDALKKINTKPMAYEYYTTPALWCDPYIAKQMLALHLNEDVELASRKKEFIDRSSEWIIKNFNIGAQSKVCDFGCGPGLYTSRFAKQGACVTGIDFSENSINFAREQAIENNLNIEYILQDYLKFATDQQFDLITMIYCDYCVLSPKQRQQLLKKFHAFLADDGKVLIDVNSLAQYDTREESCSFEFSPQDGFWSPDPYYVFHNVYSYPAESLVLDKFTIIEASRTRENYNWQQCYSLESIERELFENGLKLVEYYANVAGDAYDKASSVIAVVAEKNT